MQSPKPGLAGASEASPTSRFPQKTYVFHAFRALRPRKSVKNTVFCSCLERKPCPKPSLDGDQYSLTVKQVSTFCAFPAVKNVEKHSVFQSLRKTGPKLGPMLGPRAELCFLNLPAPYGLIHMGERKSAAQGGTLVGRVLRGARPDLAYA